MKKRVLAMVLAITLVCALAVPAGAAEPYTMLQYIAYYGDRSKCAMTAEQAQAFLEVIEKEMEKPTSINPGENFPFDTGYAALFDAGNGIPALFFVRGYGYDYLVDMDGDSIYNSFGDDSIWTYQNGQTVPFTPEFDGGKRLYDTCIMCGYTTPGDPGYKYGIYPFSNGIVSNTPVHTYSMEMSNGNEIEYYQIDGATATEKQVDALLEQWYGANFWENTLAYSVAGGGVEHIIHGFTPIEDVKIALGAYITAAQGSTRVQLHLNGGSGGSALWSNDSGTIQVPTNPTREGYTFGGWYTDEGLTTPWNFNSAVTGELTLYARWTPVSSTAATVGQNAQDISFNGKKVAVQGYTLRADNGGDVTYVKLRDVAALLDGTSAQFNVDWRNGAIYVERGKGYTTRNGTELKPVTGVQGTYRWNTAPVLFDGETKPLEGLCLSTPEGDHTFFKLRDLGAALDFTVDWSAEKGIFIETK